MNRRVAGHVLRMSAVVCLLLYSATGVGDSPREIVDQPGFRPDSPQAATFVAEYDTATVVVYPTIVRRAQRTAHSFASQSQIIELLDSAGMTVMPGNTRVNLGRLARQSQWDLFQSDLGRIAEKVRGRHPDARYHLVLEFLLPVSDGEIFGIECYVLDQDGNNAFSFLLNSHHRLFVDARLFARNSSEEARAEMFERATRAAVTALQAQLAQQQGKSEVAAQVDDHGAPSGYAINELPMFGMREKTSAQRKADEDYIRYMTKDGRSRQEAAEIAARNAWNIFYSGDKRVAIRRFNQAWLLDPDNQLALWGFAVTCVDRGQLEDAVRYYRMAIDRGPHNPGLERDYGLALRQMETMAPAARAVPAD